MNDSKENQEKNNKFFIVFYYLRENAIELFWWMRM
jgi:hypothetical protein